MAPIPTKPTVVRTWTVSFDPVAASTSHNSCVSGSFTVVRRNQVFPFTSVRITGPVFSQSAISILEIYCIIDLAAVFSL